MRRATVFPPRFLRAWPASVNRALGDLAVGSHTPTRRPRTSRPPVSAPDRRPHRQQPFPARQAPRSSRACTRFCQEAGRLDRVLPERAPAARCTPSGLLVWLRQPSSSPNPSSGKPSGAPTWPAERLLRHREHASVLGRGVAPEQAALRRHAVALDSPRELPTMPGSTVVETVSQSGHCAKRRNP